MLNLYQEEIKCTSQQNRSILFVTVRQIGGYDDILNGPLDLSLNINGRQQIQESVVILNKISFTNPIIYCSG